MAVNPMELMKLGERLRIFNSQHPRVGAFVKDVGANAFGEGAVIEVKVTSVEGKQYVTNIKVTKEDIETIEILKNIKS
jgi:hypothetical protein